MYTTVHLFCKLEAVLSALRKTFSLDDVFLCAHRHVLFVELRPPAGAVRHTMSAR